MVAKRIIPCLDIKDGRTVKGVNFVGLRDAGDPVELAKRYAAEGADELVFLDITATLERRRTFADLVGKISKVLDIPFTVGGGIKEVADVEILLENGADKVSINSAAVRRPELITELAMRFGSQCVVLAVDGHQEKDSSDNYRVALDGGSRITNIKVRDWIRDGVSRGAGEILFTSMFHDGAKNGFATEFTASISDDITVPVIASGGAGKKEHFKEIFKTSVDAGLAASIFHFGEVNIGELKEYLTKEGVEVRL